MTRALLLLVWCALGLANPTQVHIALAGNADKQYPTGMRVAWFTFSSTPTSTVQYGPSSSSLTETATGAAKEYFKTHGFHHVAYVPFPSDPTQTRVFYRVGDAAQGYSAIFSFAVAPQSVDTTVKLSIFGDMGYSDTTQRPIVIPPVARLQKHWSATYSRNVLEKLKDNEEIDMVWHLGDIGYADDAFAYSPMHFAYEKIYNSYMDWLQNITSTMPYMVTPGNHESECHSPACIFSLSTEGKAESNFTAFNNRWHMPSEESGGHKGSNMWYSYNYGPLHIISANTETDFPGAGEEHTGDSGSKLLPAGGFGYKGEYLAWLENDLKKAHEARLSKQKGAQPWIVAGGHRPYKYLQGSPIQALFEKYKVDLYVSGHAHSYARSLPTSNGRVETHHSDDVYTKPNGTVLIVVGGPGCDEMPQGPDKVYHTRGKSIHEVIKEGDPLFGLNLTNHEVYGYWLDGGASPQGAQVKTYARYATGTLVANATTLTWKLIDSVNNSVVDQVVITK